MSHFEEFVRRLSRSINRVSEVAVVGLMVIIVLNIVLRKLGLHTAWLQAFDIVGLLGLIVISFSLAHTAVQKGHVSIEVLVTRFPPRVQGIIGTITGILSLGIFTVVTWQCVELANRYRESNQTTMTAEIPIHPFLYMMAFCIGVLCLVILIDLIKSARKGLKG
jgi:TRAP-type C4-dicarboxylate transport system permease small subunit